MRKRSRQNQTSGYGSSDYGKCLCLSFPYHDLDLIKELDIQADLECAASRSHYIRTLIRRERIKRKQQEQEAQFSFSSMVGAK